MSKKTVLYDLSAIVDEDIRLAAEEIADTLDMSPSDIGRVLERGHGPYAQGLTTQGEYWSDIAAQLLLEDLEVPAVYALRQARIDQKILGYIRAQSPLMVLGLVSDATPDWVGHWRKELKLDKLLHAHIIDSELGSHHTYAELLKLAAARVQRPANEVTLVDRKPAHLETARSLGMHTVPVSDGMDYGAAMATLV